MYKWVAVVIKNDAFHMQPGTHSDTIHPEIPQIISATQRVTDAWIEISGKVFVFLCINKELIKNSPRSYYRLVTLQDCNYKELTFLTSTNESRKEESREKQNNSSQTWWDPIKEWLSPKFYYFPSQ
jgi:hypothetical protein